MGNTIKRATYLEKNQFYGILKSMDNYVIE